MTVSQRPDWRLLAPHKPLGPDDDAYVARPVGGGDAIAAWVAAGGGTVLVSGPAGVGKSTELAHAAAVLRSSRFSCLLQVDRKANMHRISADELLRLTAVELIDVAQREQLPISNELRAAGRFALVADPVTGAFQGSGGSIAQAAVEEIARVSGRRVALLLDGLEKLKPGPETGEIFEELSRLSESVDLVVVIPWHVAFGRGTEPIIQAGERLHRIAALSTDGSEVEVAAEFLWSMLSRRYPSMNVLQALTAKLLSKALAWSGGIPRIFLQLIADAGTYARVKRGADWPDDTDLQDAVEDQKRSFRRALLPGDTEAISRVAGTDGRELDIERRIRLLAQGLLLERVYGGETSLVVHPLLSAVITLY